MSIILKALSRADEDKENPEQGKEETKKNDQGFSKDKVVLSEPDIKSGSKFRIKRVYILGGAVFLLILVFVIKLLVGGVAEEPASGASSISQPDIGTTLPVEKNMGKVTKVGVPKKDDKSTTGIIGKAIIAYNSGKYDKSAKLFKTAIEQNPGDAFLHNNLGLVYVKKGLYSSAESEYEEALELDDKCAECFNNFGYLKSVLDQSVEAKKYLERAIALSGSYADPYFNLAVLYEKEGDIGNSVKYFRRFVDLYPDQSSEIIYKVSLRIRELSGK